METDLELLDSAKQWGKEALAKIFDLYASALFHYALRLGCDPMTADQIVWDVFARFLEQISLGKGPKTNLRSYLYQTTHRLIVDHGHSSRRNAALEVANPFRDDVNSASPSSEDRVMLDVILRVIQNDLTEDQRHVIVLRFLEDFSLKETAAILDKKVSHIKVIQNRAIAKLRKHLGYSGTETIT